MKTLERSELKKINGGTESDAGSGIQCWCPNGNYINCGNRSSSECFDLVYWACGGEPALQCSFT